MKLKYWLKYKWQRLTKGFGDDEVWNLDVTIAEFILPRLKRLREIQHGFPACLDKDGEDLGAVEWDRRLDSMIEAFIIISNECYWDMDSEMNKVVKEGLNYFREHFFDLWD